MITTGGEPATRGRWGRHGDGRRDLYGFTQGGSLGTVGLIFAAVLLTCLAVLVIAIRDADVSAMDTAALTDSAAAARPPGDSIWPAISAVGGVLVVVGLVTYPPIFIFGIIALVAAAVDWMVQAYAERASGDPTFNAAVASASPIRSSSRSSRPWASPSSSTR